MAVVELYHFKPEHVPLFPFPQKSKLSTNVLETKIESGSLFGLKYYKTSSWIIDCFITMKYCALIITSWAKTVLCRIADCGDKSSIVFYIRLFWEQHLHAKIYIYILELNLSNSQECMCKAPRAMMCSSIILLRKWSLKAQPISDKVIRHSMPCLQLMWIYRLLISFTVLVASGLIKHHKL